MLKIEKERDCVYFNFSFTIKLAIGLNVFPRDPSPLGRISLPVSLLNFFNREELPNSELTSDVPITSSYRGPRPYDNESWNDPRDFAKPFKAISLPHDVPNASNRRLVELENQVQRLMEADLAPKPSVQVNKIASSCEICSGPHDTQYCMENSKQAFVDYASSRTDEAGESLVFGKNGSAFIQGEMPKKMKDPGLFTLPCRLGDSKPLIPYSI
uniref:MAK10-like protein n=1 Tax=Tanacetum cinerariifolium TaxID=118510 RepID=A0A6L2JR40_TANCI|nr:MAK10-like protein [Tanacetum cinerariifolium]